MKQTTIEAQLKKELSAKRYCHTIGVVESALSLAKRYRCNLDQASTAALLHDCAKNFSSKELIDYADKNKIKTDRITLIEPQLLHGPVGAIVAKTTYNIEEKEILNAIRYHTTGRKNMSKLEKIIYLADFIEPGRVYPGVDELRKLAFVDLDRAVIKALTNTICYVASLNGLIHERTIKARNDLLIKEMKRK
jgi:predicted HD superfamily hydrolase involved in NAD metabolism